MTDVIGELEKVQAHPTDVFEATLRRRMREHVGGTQSHATFLKLAGWLMGFIGLSRLRGREVLLREADELARQTGTTPPPVPPAPTIIDVSGGFPEGVPFQFREAIRDIVSRDPRVVQSSAEVAQVMRSGGFSAARLADVRTGERVRDEIAKMERAGTSTKDARKVVARLTGWSEAYADTVVQTNAATAYAAGRMEQAQRPAVRAVAPAFELIGPVDSNTRPNHAAAVGLIAGVDDPIWREFGPPLGYRCRHSLSLVPRRELERRGLLLDGGLVARYLPPGFSKAHRDVGFAQVLA